MPVAEQPRSSKLGDSLSRYPGKWVAIRDDEVVDSADSFDRLRERTKGKKLDSYFKVPQEKPGGGVFL